MYAQVFYVYIMYVYVYSISMLVRSYEGNSGENTTRGDYRGTGEWYVLERYGMHRVHARLTRSFVLWLYDPFPGLTPAPSYLVQICVYIIVESSLIRSTKDPYRNPVLSRYY